MRWKSSLNSLAASRYEWIIVAVGVLVMLACLGVARFAFGIILPAMAKGLALDYEQQGWLGTGYFSGYMVMVALAPFLAARTGNRAAITLGLSLIALSMASLGFAGGYVPALVLYSATGVGSSAANISMMAMIANWFGPARRGTATGLVIMGNGLGIILSGFLVPLVVEMAGENGWRVAWLCLALVAALVAIMAGVFLRNAPKDQRERNQSEPTPSGKGHGRFITHLGLIYFLFGLTYIVYATFFVTTLVDEQAFAHDVAGRFWAWVGFFSLFSGPLLGRVSDVMGRRSGLVAAYGVQTGAYLLAAYGVLVSNQPALYGSVVLFGLTAWSVPAIMAATIADRLGPKRTAKGFSQITFFLAVGQVLGPVGAGKLANHVGGFAWCYAICAGLTLCAIALSLALPGRDGQVS